jgi:hypothetical protein
MEGNTSSPLKVHYISTQFVCIIFLATLFCYLNPIDWLLRKVGNRIVKLCTLHIGTNLEGMAKLSLAIKRVGFVARQFALWVIPIIWWDISKEAIQVCFH